MSNLNWIILSKLLLTCNPAPKQHTGRAWPPWVAEGRSR